MGERPGAAHDSVRTDGARQDYVVAFTDDHLDCIICPRAYYVEQNLTALGSRRVYPFVRVFTACSAEQAILIGKCIFREDLASRGERDQNAV